jgi:hypothetical protein
MNGISSDQLTLLAALDAGLLSGLAGRLLLRHFVCSRVRPGCSGHDCGCEKDTQGQEGMRTGRLFTKEQAIAKGKRERGREGSVGEGAPSFATRPVNHFKRLRDREKSGIDEQN